MRKVLISLSIIGAVAAIVVGATTAYFSDTETSSGNVVKAGSLDLTLNGFNGVTAGPVIEISDMKPSQVKYSKPITLKVFDNPGKLYKHIVKPANGIIACDTGDLTEPECTEQGGRWDAANRTCDWGSTIDENYLPKVTWFDLEVWVGPNPVPPQGDPQPICDANQASNCWKTIIPDNLITVEEIASKWIYLGTYGNPNQTNEITIRQSFHIKKEAKNEYQGDKCVFDEEFMVSQTNAEHPDNCYDPLNNGVCKNP